MSKAKKLVLVLIVLMAFSVGVVVGGLAVWVPTSNLAHRWMMHQQTLDRARTARHLDFLDMVLNEIRGVEELSELSARVEQRREFVGQTLRYIDASLELFGADVPATPTTTTNTGTQGEP